MIHLRDRLSPTLPVDLTEQIEPTRLMRMVFDALDATNWPRATTAMHAVLPTVLAYCYATGLSSSAQIEAAAAHDPHVRYLCAKSAPTFDEVRQFRRQNISPLRETLARVLFEAWSELHGGNVSFLPFIAEADYRLSLAVAADSAAMDI